MNSKPIKKSYIPAGIVFLHLYWLSRDLMAQWYKLWEKNLDSSHVVSSTNTDFLSWSEYMSLKILSVIFCSKEMKKMSIVQAKLWRRWLTLRPLSKLSQRRCTEHFFKKLFEKQINRILAPSDCLHCGQSLETTKDRKIHNFSKHQEKGVLFEKRSIFIERFAGVISYEVTYSNHQDFYNFTNPEYTVVNFLNVVKRKFVPPGQKVQEKYTFSIQNFQPALTENMIELAESRL